MLLLQIVLTDAEAATLVTVIIALIGGVVWTVRAITRLQEKVKRLEESPILEAFKGYIKTKGVVGFIGETLKDFEGQLVKEKPKKR